MIKVHKIYFNRRILLSKCSFCPKALTVHTGGTTVSFTQQPLVKKHPQNPQTIAEVWPVGTRGLWIRLLMAWCDPSFKIFIRKQCVTIPINKNRSILAQWCPYTHFGAVRLCHQSMVLSCTSTPRDWHHFQTWAADRWTSKTSKLLFPSLSVSVGICPMWWWQIFSSPQPNWVFWGGIF